MRGWFEGARLQVCAGEPTLARTGERRMQTHSPKGAEFVSPGRKSWELGRLSQSPEGRHEFSRTHFKPRHNKINRGFRMCMRTDAVPCGTRPALAPYPALTCRANEFRPFGAGILTTFSHCSHKNRVLAHILQPLSRPSNSAVRPQSSSGSVGGRVSFKKNAALSGALIVWNFSGA